MPTRSIPWPRILAEGVAIVVSILLAFGIQAWWEGRQDSQRVQGYLVALHGEIEITRSELLNDLSRREQRLESWQSILAAMSMQSPVPADTMQAWLGTLWGSARTSTSSAVYDDLTTSGSLDLIQSDELRYALLQYGQEKDRLVNFEDRLLETWEVGVRPYLVATTDVIGQIRRTRNLGEDWFPPPGFDDGFEDILTDRTFQNLLLVRVDMLAVVMRTARGLMEDMNELQRLIDGYVE